MVNGNCFTPSQQSYLQGFALGTDVARRIQGLPVLSGTAGLPGQTVQVGPQGASAVAGIPARPVPPDMAAQDQVLAAGGKLSSEEKAKRAKPPLDLWTEMREKARQGEFPKGTDTFLWKFHGLFYVAPAQDSYMCRLRFPGGILTSSQLQTLARLCESHGGGWLDCTTRANLQIRMIPAEKGPGLLQELSEAGIVPRGSGADNVRNITASATSGIDPDELIETHLLAKELNHHILQTRELYGLPRKFNISFEGGGRIATLEDTNDIGFQAVSVEPHESRKDLPAGIYFRLSLGGITGHHDFARSTGVLIEPEECLPVADAILRVFMEHGDRTDRNQARLKYLLDKWGFDRFLAEVETRLGRSLKRAGNLALLECPSPNRWAHVGVHSQKQTGRSYIGLVLPVGRLTAGQARRIARLADRFGSGQLRLTVWQNMLIPDIANEDLPTVQNEIEDMGLDWQASSVRAGLIACTGNAGCRFAASDTKSDADYLARFLDERMELDVPINIHFTGCHHSCAQHYIGDIGLRGTKVEQGDDMVEGYEVVIGGGYADQQGIARQLLPAVTSQEIPSLVERLLEFYLCRRQTGESFSEFSRRHEIATLRQAALQTPELVS